MGVCELRAIPRSEDAGSILVWVVWTPSCKVRLCGYYSIGCRAHAVLGGCKPIGVQGRPDKRWSVMKSEPTSILRFWLVRISYLFPFYFHILSFVCIFNVLRD